MRNWLGGQWWRDSPVSYPTQLANPGQELCYHNDLDRLSATSRPIQVYQLRTFMQIDLANLLPDLPGNLSGISPSRYVFYQDVLVRFLIDRTWTGQGHPLYQAAETLAIKEKNWELCLSLWNSGRIEQILSGKEWMWDDAFVKLIK